MNEGKFEQNFVWYEWSFVSPADMPSSLGTEHPSYSGGRSRTTPPEGEVRGYGMPGDDTRKRVPDEERPHHDGFNRRAGLQLP